MLMKAIRNLRPNSEFSLDGENIIWLDKTQTQPTDAELQEWIKANKDKELNKMELARLDKTLPRWAEDLLEGKTLYGEVKETVNRKKDIRKLL